MAWQRWVRIDNIATIANFFERWIAAKAETCRVWMKSGDCRHSTIFHSKRSMVWRISRRRRSRNYIESWQPVVFIVTKALTTFAALTAMWSFNRNWIAPSCFNIDLWPDSCHIEARRLIVQWYALSVRRTSPSQIERVSQSIEATKSLPIVENHSRCTKRDTVSTSISSIRERMLDSSSKVRLDFFRHCDRSSTSLCL